MNTSRLWKLIWKLSAPTDHQFSYGTLLWIPCPREDEDGLVLAAAAKRIWGSWASAFLQSRECPLNGLGVVLQDCLELIQRLDVCSWSYVLRSGNVVAHALCHSTKVVSRRSPIFFTRLPTREVQ
ncbi:hypothetical protein GH714_030997 [Hevea brasiliensis]|uniref:RNase H type-1 domain-containing protein n=1 Tax=Hevea brasiliensis TaxID=3981 RepID=A0A6A6LNY4_HEVBR|nr:hypothetical protein GH714_030997 [Hevea brasiliensis]